MRNFSTILLLIVGVFCLTGCPPLPPPPPEPLADYGDAPDGDVGMGTGYYGFTGSGFGVYTLGSISGPADFPTIGTDPIPGPFMLDVDDFWIGPMFFPVLAANAPSVESGATDVADPDGVPNLTPPPPLLGQSADDDFEGPPISGIVLIFAIAVPPPAIFISSANVLTAPASSEGIGYWNVLIDLGQDGAWDNTLEWVAQDIYFPMAPGTNQLLVSPVFSWPTAGGGFGRLIFPLWARNMVTDAPVRSSVPLQLAPPVQYWDGRGPVGGFPFGEVEDYFLEWRPVGPMFSAVRPESIPTNRLSMIGIGSAVAQQPEKSIQPLFVRDLEQISCPESIGSGEEVMCEIAQTPQNAVTVLCAPDGEEGGVAIGTIHLSVANQAKGFIEDEACMLRAELSSDSLTLTLEYASPNATLLAFPSVNQRDERSDGSNVKVIGGARIVVK